MKPTAVVLELFILLSASLYGQSGSINNTLGTGGTFTIKDASNTFLTLNHGSLLLSGTTGTTPTSGPGTRLMWIPAKGAFRAGVVNGTYWDDANDGYYSTAMGYNTMASSGSSTAMGYSTTANAFASTAMGYSTTASGYASTAMGDGTTANASFSTAMGNGTTARNFASTAMGNGTTASGYASTAMGGGTFAGYDFSTAMGVATQSYGTASTAMGDSTSASAFASTAMGYHTIASYDCSTAMGYHTTASNVGSTAMGAYTTASGPYSTALGYYTQANGQSSTVMGTYAVDNGYAGCLVIGDASAGGYLGPHGNSQFMAAFANGYTLYTTRMWNQGVYMNGGTSGWTNISDRNEKENFRPIDGEELLQKIRSMSITEWNYKHSDPSIKYIGPVAQDFYAAFHLGGKDSLGINTICIDGVNMAGVQALEKRTAELREKTAELEVLKSEIADLKARVARLEQALSVSKDFTQRVSDETGRQR